MSHRISNTSASLLSLVPSGKGTNTSDPLLEVRFSLETKPYKLNQSVKVDEMVHISVSEQAFVKGFMVFLAVI